ncbi:MAG: choice-of-anchor J domain-containing protein [Clostridia bacterium]|nr:choice-of-anchor J domain-containing protein [Clostridia bacterium]
MKRTARKTVGVLLTLLMVFTSVFALAFPAIAEDPPCEHLYGTTGENRYTCVKCGAVDEALHDAFCCPVVPPEVSATVSWDFETDPIENGWSFTDLDGDGHNWGWYYGTTPTMQTNSGVGSIYSYSYDSDSSSPLDPDNWAVSPAVEIPAGGSLSFLVCGQDASWADEHYQVYVGEGGALADLVPVSDVLVATGDFENIVIDLSEWAGKSVHIGFRHYDVTDMFALVIDDVSVGTMGETPERTDHTFGDEGNDRFVCQNCGYFDLARLNASPCGDFDFYENFETDPEEKGWTFTDADGDGYNWYWLSNPSLKSHSGYGHLTSASYAGGILYPDNYASSPLFTVSEGATLTFWAVGQDPSFAEENFAVYLEGEDSLIPISGELTSAADYRSFSYDLSDYAGMTTRLVFRHYDVYDMFRINLDDVAVYTELYDAHDFKDTWEWAEDLASAVCTLTCQNCGRTHVFAADVAEGTAEGTYTASVIYDGVTYTDTASVVAEPQTVHLTFDMDGKCANYECDAEIGSSMTPILKDAVLAADAEGYLLAGFAPLTPDHYPTMQAFAAAMNQLLISSVPETDTVYYANWFTRVTPAFAVGELKCGADLKTTLPALTAAEPEKYTFRYTQWTEDDPGVAAGGETYALYTCVEAAYRWAFFTTEDPAVDGAEVIEQKLNGTQHYLILGVTARHYADETSLTGERVLTEPTATVPGEKEICVFCAGGCGEIVETYTEEIPATGEPDEPSEEGEACPYCGEFHDEDTLSGWWTALIHDILFIIQRICFWFI